MLRDLTISCDVCLHNVCIAYNKLDLGYRYKINEQGTKNKHLKKVPPFDWIKERNNKISVPSECISTFANL